MTVFPNESTALAVVRRLFAVDAEVRPVPNGFAIFASRGAVVDALQRDLRFQASHAAECRGWNDPCRWLPEDAATDLRARLRALGEEPCA